MRSLKISMRPQEELEENSSSVAIPRIYECGYHEYFFPYARRIPCANSAEMESWKIIKVGLTSMFSH